MALSIGKTYYKRSWNMLGLMWMDPMWKARAMRGKHQGAFWKMDGSKRPNGYLGLTPGLVDDRTAEFFNFSR